MAKFILIDSNIAGDGGHYLEYAEQILEVAAGRGFDCHLAANMAFDRNISSGANYTSHSIFSHDMWGRNLWRRRREPNKFTIEDRRYLRDYYSIAGLLWNASGALSAVKHYSQQTTLASAMARRLYQVHAVRTKVEALQAHAFDDLPDVSDGEAEDRAVRYHSFRRALRQAAREPVVSLPEGRVIAGMIRQSRASDSYGVAIARLLDELEVGVDDYVFVPTLSLGEARSLRDLLRRDARAQQPHWSLLFRRDVYDGYTADWFKQDWAAHEARNLFASFLPLTRRARLSFFTDTDLLTRQYNMLGSVPFHTTAIPVRTTERAVDSDDGEMRWKLLVLCPPSSRSSMSTFLGLIESLTHQDLKQVRFLLPAILMGSPEGTTRGSGASARARLRPYINDAVTIINLQHGLKEVFAHLDGCIVIEPESLPASIVEDCADQLQKLAVLAPSKSEFARTLKKRGGHSFEYSPTKDVVGSLVQTLHGLLAELSTARAPEDRLTIGYLGDARAEKGFHLLPEIIDTLNADVGVGQAFFLEAQVYHPDPSSDIRMLRAMERVRQMPSDRVNRHEGALSSADYQAIIARSDVILNVYARHNYISRSSGIFVEALASLKPVLTISGTWMSALMGEWSQAYHDFALRLSRALSERLFAEADDWSFLGESDRTRARAVKMLELKPGVSACSSLAIPEGANHVRLEVRTGSTSPDAPLSLVVAWQDERELTFLELERQLNRITPGVISSVFPVPAEARFLWIGISLGAYLKSCPIEWVRASWHATGGPIAEMPGGIAVADGNDAKILKNCVDAARALQISYPAYADSCSWVFEQWCKDQNALSLFNDLMTTPPARNQSVRRFVGKDW